MSGIVYAAEKKKIAVSVDCPENLTFSHDSKWTSEALFNLLDNAVKYTPAGGKITVSVIPWEMYVEIKVADTGKGISESNHYVHTFGNLTITGYNSTLSNKAFNEKKERKDNNGQYIGYRNGLNLNDDVCDKDEWTVDIIKARTDRMVKEIMAMFAL